MNSSSMRTTGFSRAAALSLVGAALAGLVFGCAARNADRAGPEENATVTWNLDPQAAATYYYLLFLDLARDGNFTGAAQALHKAVQNDPSRDLYLQSSELNLKLGRVAESRALLKEGLERYPDDRMLHVRLADTYLVERRYADAITTLELYRQKHPDDPDVRNKLVQVLIEADRADEALDIMSKVPKDQIGAAENYLQARANLKLGLRKKAIRLLRQARDQDPRNIAILAELAFLYELEKDYPAAERAYLSILEQGDASQEVWLRLIQIDLKLNDPAKALSRVQEGPGTPQFLMEAGRLFLADGFIDEARSILEPLADVDEPPAELPFYLALLAFQGEKNPQKALDLLNEFPTESAYAPKAEAFRAQLLFALGKPEQALHVIRRGKAAHPDELSFYETESLILESQNETGKAEAAVREGLERQPEDAGLLYRLATLQDKAGDRDAAIATAERIIAKDPDNADALNFVGYLLTLQNTNLERALVLINRALELRPESPYIMDSLAWVQFRMGQTAKAWETIQATVALAHEDAAIWDHYGDIAAAMGRKQEARRGYKRALELGIENPEAVRAKLNAL